MNKVWEIGRLTKEPEIRYTSKKNGNGEEESTVTASYTLAVARGYRHEDGQQDADFFRCVAFGKNAEFAESKRDQTSGGNAGEIDMDTEFLDISKMSEEELPFR